MRDVQAEADVLRKLPFSRMDEREVYAAVQKFASGYTPWTVFTYPPPLFRARKIPNGEDFRNVIQTGQNIWAPPPSLVPTGRFNHVGVPALYVSSTAEGAILEVNPKSGDQIAILLLSHPWGAEPFDFTQIGLERFPGHDPKLVKSSVRGGLRANSQFIKALEADGGNLEDWLIQDDLFSEFAGTRYNGDPPAEYKMTLALHAGLSSETDGIMYPSVASSYRALNYCIDIRPALRLQLSEVWLVDVKDVTKDARNLLVSSFHAHVKCRGIFGHEGAVEWGAAATSTLEDETSNFLAHMAQLNEDARNLGIHRPRSIVQLT